MIIVPCRERTKVFINSQFRVTIEPQLLTKQTLLSKETVRLACFLFRIHLSCLLAHIRGCPLTLSFGPGPGVEQDGTSGVRQRIQERSYIQEQYVLTRCSLSSERGVPTRPPSRTNASSVSEAAGGPSFPLDSRPGPLMEAGSLPQGLEKMPAPEQKTSLSRWSESPWQLDLSSESTNSSKRVRPITLG